MNIQCNDCGKRISHKDIKSGEAVKNYRLDFNLTSGEVNDYECFLCKKCEENSINIA